MSAPIALTINVREIAAASLPEALETRLRRQSGEKSPEELASEIEANTKRTAALREAHLQATKDRASRESARAAEAAARKLRIAASRAEKIQSKADATMKKVDAKKEANEAEREARKARRLALAAAVLEARKSADEARDVRKAQQLAAEALASAKHAKTIGDLKAKGAQAVKHAIAVVAQHKEKEASALADAAEKMHSKQSAAEIRREVAAAEAAATSSLSGSPAKSARAARALNNGKVACEMARLLHEASMAKASERAAAHTAGVKERAAAVAAKAAAVVAQKKAVALGTDDATIEAKAALYDKMVRAETARLFALKAKYGARTAANKGDTVSVIVVRMNDVLTPRAPPAALACRLSAVSQTLVATSKARQMGAKARRVALAHAALLKCAKANERRAAAIAKIGKAHALLKAKVAAKARHAADILAIGIGKRSHALSAERERVRSALLKREQLAAATTLKGKECVDKCEAAAERRATTLRLVAKPGVVAVRAAANLSRREAAAKAVTERGAVFAARCEAAAARKAEILEKRVAVAKRGHFSDA